MKSLYSQIEKIMVRYLRKRHDILGPSKQFLYLKKGRHQEELTKEDQQTFFQKKGRPTSSESRCHSEEVGEIRHLHHDRRVRLHRPLRQLNKATHVSVSSCSLSPAGCRLALLLLQEEARTGNFGEQAESEIQGYTNQKNSSESKDMWKKMGVKEFPRGNNLWASPADPELAHQLLPGISNYLPLLRWLPLRLPTLLCQLQNYPRKQ